MKTISTQLLFIALALSALNLNTAKAQVFTLPQLTEAQIDPLFKTLSSDLAYRPVEGAAPLSGIAGVGLYFGATLIGTSSKPIADIIGKDFLLPGAFIDIGVGLPFGLGLEIGFVPSLKISGTKFSNYGGNLRWNFSKFLPMVPVDLALRLMYTNSSLESQQLLSGSTIDIAYKAKQLGFMVTAGKTFGLIEPYVSLGFIKTSPTLSYAGSTSLFGTSFATGTTSVSKDISSLWFNTGLQLRFPIFALGLQYDNMLSTSAYSAKVSFRF